MNFDWTPLNRAGQGTVQHIGFIAAHAVHNFLVACLVRKGFAIRVPKSKDPSGKVQKAIKLLLNDDDARRKAEQFSKVMEKWDGPKMAAELLFEKFVKGGG